MRCLLRKNLRRFTLLIESRQSALWQGLHRELWWLKWSLLWENSSHSFHRPHLRQIRHSILIFIKEIFNLKISVFWMFCNYFSKLLSINSYPRIRVKLCIIFYKASFKKNNLCITSYLADYIWCSKVSNIVESIILLIIRDWLVISL